MRPRCTNTEPIGIPPSRRPASASAIAAAMNSSVIQLRGAAPLGLPHTLSRALARGAADSSWSRERASTERSFAKGEVHSAQQAEAGPQEIEPQWLPHVKHRKRHEHRERDHFLHHFQLAKFECPETDAIGRHLQHVLEERDAPARENGDDEGPGTQVPKVCVPGKRHEHVRKDQQHDGLDDDGWIDHCATRRSYFVYLVNPPPAAWREIGPSA